MRSSILFCFAPVALCAAAAPSLAAVTISNAATANMTCSGGVCAPTAAEAVLNVQDLEAMLASGNATVTTTGAGVQAKDVRVNARLTWSSATTLALDAYHSIEVNAKVTVAGTGGLSLKTNDGGSGGDFACNDPGRLQFNNVSSPLAINGTAYTLENSVALLANAIAGNPSGAFALARNYNAKKDGIYTASPIPTTLAGAFDGLGNTISNLSINDSADNAEVGLFAEIAQGSMIANIRLVNENVRSSGSWSSVGGLVGFAGGAIAHSFNSGNISGGGNGSFIGGLVGEGAAAFRSSGSAVAVSSGWAAGGLIGLVEGSPSITDSWATGNVSGKFSVGGLVGFQNDADIRRSWASGQVSTIGNDWTPAGGLVGIEQAGSIERSHASGSVSCNGPCGGLVGWQGDDGGAPKVSQSYAMGSVTAVPISGNGNGWPSAGGLVGWKECGEISNSYASGSVKSDLAGGLVGENDVDRYSLISSSYATGAVAHAKWAGGLIGLDSGRIKRAYWDTTTSGITNSSQGAGNVANEPGIKGLSDKKLKSGLPRGFDSSVWKEDSRINSGLPYLINNPPAN